MEGALSPAATRPDTSVLWERRHVRILAVLLAQVAALFVFALARGHDVLHAAVEVAPSASLAVVASSAAIGRRWRSVAASVGLMAQAATLVHLSGDRADAHFAYFVLLALLALYEDWLPYVAAVLFVIVQHGVMGVVDADLAYGGEGAAWVGAAIHGLFVMAASAVAFLSWRGRERERDSWEAQIRDNEEAMRVILDAAPIGMGVTSPDGRFTRVNPALCRMVGRDAGDLVGRAFASITHEDDRAGDRMQVERCLAGEIEGYERDTRYLHRDGHVARVHISVVLVRDADGAPSHFVTQMLDVTEGWDATQSLAASEARLAAMVEHGSDLIAIMDPVGALVYASPAYRTMLGFEPEAMVGRLIYEDVHPDDRDEAVQMGIALRSDPGGTATMQLRFAHADGSWRWVEATMTNRLDDAAVAGFVVNASDVTDRVVALEQAAHRASHDALTGLPNRSLLEDRMTQAAAAAARHDELLVALFVDLDHFKDVNDTYGHGAGDAVLAEAAARLRRSARAEDTVARLGGDEFVVTGRVADERAAAILAARAWTAFTEPFEALGHIVRMTVSVGVATSGRGRDAAGLLAAADVALYEAKARGRDQWVAYDDAMGHRGGRGATTPSGLG